MINGLLDGVRLTALLESEDEMTFDEWHKKQLGGDPDNCPHEAWERKAWEAATKAEREACAKVCESHQGIKIPNGPRLPPDGSACARAIRERSRA